VLSFPNTYEVASPSSVLETMTVCRAATEVRVACIFPSIQLFEYGHCFSRPGSDGPAKSVLNRSDIEDESDTKLAVALVAMRGKVTEWIDSII